MTQEALIRRLQISCLGLDPIDPLRLLVDDVIEALAQTQEPVGVVHHKLTSTLGADYEQVAVFYRPVEQGTKLYTAVTTPPQRTWVDLTDEEIDNINYTSAHMLAREVLAKFKEKNT
jgi:hypothetical protein